MAVIVLGMDLPESCMMCEFNYDLMGCAVTGASTIWAGRSISWKDCGIDLAENRMPSCPLRELEDDDDDWEY